jgi:cytochrome P450
MIDVTFLIAGQETTANSLGFAILEISKNPEVLKKLDLFL